MARAVRATRATRVTSARKRSRSDSSYIKYLNNNNAYYVAPAVSERKGRRGRTLEPTKRKLPKRPDSSVKSHIKRRTTGKKVVGKKNTVKKAVKKKPRNVIYEYAVENNGSAAFLTYVLMGVIFVGLIMSVITFAVKSSDMLILNNMISEHKRLSDENANAARENYEYYDLIEIEQMARRLGMQEPQDYQKVYISFETESYIIQYDDDETRRNEYKFGWAEILNIFRFWQKTGE